MDPFEVRMQFLGLLRKLNATQASIQKVVAFALKNHARCADDLWDCITEECARGSVHMRINILHALDALADTARAGAPRDPPYIAFIARDLPTLIGHVVPDERDGLLNHGSARQILEDWRRKRVIDTAVVEEALALLEKRQESLHMLSSTSSRTFHRHDVLVRIEEDRERHKRLRERRWVQPVQHGRPPALAAFLPREAREPHPLDIEFADAWETTSDWNEDDDESAEAENALAFPSLPLRRRPSAMEVDRPTRGR